MKFRFSLRIVTAIVFVMLVSARATKCQRASPGQVMPTHAYAARVYFTNASDGWVLADKDARSFILRTTDGGDHWALQYQSKEAGVFEIKFANPDSGWAVGNNGTILHTSDRGTTWKRQISGTTEVLTGLSIIDANTAWVSGASGTILHTGDGGKAWNSQEVNTKIAIPDITFVDKQHGWAIGYGTIFSTNDGGNTWQLQRSGDWKQLSSVLFANKNLGWITVGPVILRTIDGGKTWDETIPPSQGKVAGLSFVDTQHGWVAKSRGEEGSIVQVLNHDKLSSESFILSTSDGGANWQELFHVKSKTDHSAWVLNIFFVDLLRGWAVGRNGLLLRTTDGGKTWTRLEELLH